MLPNKRSYASNVLAELDDSSPIEGIEFEAEITSSHSILSSGAALYSSRIADEQPTYLDTLPAIKLASYIAGKPDWLPLLNDSDSYVDGGKLWQRPKPVQGLQALAGSNTLEVTLWHDEYPTARRVKTEFPTKLPRNVAILLSVSVQPAQGNARVEIVPDDASLFGSRKVFMEWHRMEDLPETPEKWLEINLPTLFPELLKRASSSSLWSNAESEILAYLNLKHPTPEHLERVISRLRQKDGSGVAAANEEGSQTASSSDGQIASVNSQVLDVFVKATVEAVLAARRQPKPDLIRALAYTGTANEEFQKFLARRIQEASSRLKQHELAACGWCLRDPAQIAMFSLILLRRLKDGIDGQNNWLKAFGEMLRYREDGTRDIPTARCSELTRYLLQVLESELRAGNAKFLFRNSCLCIVFLLRRRAFDEDYLRPGSIAYEEVSGAFKAAIEGFGNLQVIGGAFAPKKILKVLLQYLDRKGPPILRGGIELRGLID
jgi:hypothetical protein